MKFYDSELKVMDLLCARQSALTEFLDKFYQGSVGLLFASLLARENLSPEEAAHLRSMIEDKK